MVIDLAGQDQPEHDVQFLQAFERNKQERDVGKLQINRSNVGFTIVVYQVVAGHNCRSVFAQWLNQNKRKPTQGRGAALDLIGIGAMQGMHLCSYSFLIQALASMERKQSPFILS